MRMRAFLTLALALGTAAAARAGVYNSAEPDEGPLHGNVLGNFRPTLITLQTIGAPKVEVERPLRRRYLLQEKLFDKVDPAKLSAEEKLNFSAVLIRRRRASDAMPLLISASRQHGDNFLLQSNLATAYHQIGDTAKAMGTMRDCLDLWPKELHELSEPQKAFLTQIGWMGSGAAASDSDKQRYASFREAETYYLKLLRLRSREKPGPYDAVDALFDVNFVGDSGKFEPGKLAKGEKAKLPRNALEIVEQLLVWLPEDLRLYWLLGEVANAQGDVENIKAARKIFDELVWLHNVRAEEVKARRAALNSWAEPEGPGLNLDEEPSAPPPPPPALDWRSLLVAFAAGLVVAIFGHWQIREVRRRLQSKENP
jgi:hypothetical protein